MKILYLLPVLGLAACQANEMASTPRSIVFSGVGQPQIADATAKAQAHCQKFKRDAELVPDGVADGNATFKCVD